MINSEKYLLLVRLHSEAFDNNLSTLFNADLLFHKHAFHKLDQAAQKVPDAGRGIKTYASDVTYVGIGKRTMEESVYIEVPMG